MTFQSPYEPPTVTDLTREEAMLKLRQKGLNSLQGLVTGSIAGALMSEMPFLDITSQIEHDGENLLPSILVRGNQSGTLLRVSIDVVEEGDVKEPA